MSPPSVVTVVCEDMPSDSCWDFVESQSFSLSRKRNFACVEGQEDMNYEGTPVKAPLCPQKKDDDAFATAELLFVNGRRKPLGSAQERTAIARMEQHVNNSQVFKVEIAEVEECSLGPEYSDVDVKHILRSATREGRRIFEVFSVREKGEHPVASKWRWDDGQKQRRPQKEIDWKGQSPEVGDRRKWLAAHEDVAKIIMLKYLGDDQDLKVSLRELKEQLECLEETDISFMQIAKQARNERGQKLFQIFGQEENVVHIASRARWDAQLKGLVELEKGVVRN